MLMITGKGKKKCLGWNSMIMLDDHENAHKYALPLLVVGLDYVLAIVTLICGTAPGHQSLFMLAPIPMISEVHTKGYSRYARSVEIFITS